MTHRQRLKKTCNLLKQEGLDGMLVASPSNISYLSGYASRDSYLLISPKENIYITDFRYANEARACLDRSFKVMKVQLSIFKRIAILCEELKLKRVAFEERVMPFAEIEKIREESSKKFEFIPKHGIIEQLRRIKSADELRKLKAAVRITIEAMRFIKDFIQPGRREIEIAGELERFIRYNGAKSAAFDIIVASGPNSAFPHHIASQRKLKNDEPVLIDMGVDYLGYKSDLTRMFFLGRITPLVRKIYEIVLAAQERAIKSIRPATKMRIVDSAARQYITRRGYGGFFGHNLGHGIGLDVHEEPCISSREESKLSAGMLFTVEPAVYLPGKFGIRIEDVALVTGRGCEVLSGGLDK
ncbi:M24 family metallopeptidase [Candidatus Omnitrophota bacterium]